MVIPKAQRVGEEKNFQSFPRIIRHLHPRARRENRRSVLRASPPLQRITTTDCTSSERSLYTYRYIIHNNDTTTPEKKNIYSNPVAAAEEPFGPNHFERCA